MAVARPDPGRRLGAVLAAILVMAGCGSGGTKAANPDDLAVAVASYDLATGPPTRFIVGILTVDQRLLGYGSVDLRFSFLGSKQGGGGGPFGPAVRATYLPIYGSTVPSPAPATPQIVAESDTRGVYGAETTFDKAGFWQVLASTTIDGKLRKGTGAFQVSPTHAVPAPGDQALATDNLTLASTDVPQAAIESRAGSGSMTINKAAADWLYRDNELNEPWVFVIGADGRITARFDNVVTRDELEPLLKALPVIGKA